MLGLVEGNIYRRTDLQDRFGGQRQGGISTPKQFPIIMLFTGYSGTQHGYDDGWSEGVFCYFGEGQLGAMPWVRGNLAIRDHAQNGRDLLLFEILREPRSHVKYLGAFAAASWEYRQAPDRAAEMRQAIVFHLVPIATPIQVPGDAMERGSDLSNLRRAALDAGTDAPAKQRRQALVTYIQRSAAIRDYALARADGHCERCNSPAPFRTSTGAPFLEVHHIRRLTDGGPDRAEAVAAVCPNCHREAHFGANNAALNQFLLTTIAAKEGERSTGR